MLNITVLALRAAQFTLVPMFAQKHNMHVLQSHFSKFAAPVFYQTSILRMAKSSFTNGLSAAIMSESNSWTDESGQKEVTISDLTFIDISASENGVIYGIWKSVAIERALFSRCKNENSESTTHFASSGEISISYTCFFQCQASKHSALKLIGQEGSSDRINVDCVTASKCDGSGATFSFYGLGYVIYRLNTSQCSSCGLEVVRTDESSMLIDASYGAIEKSNLYCGIYFDSVKSSQTMFSQFQIVNNTILGQGLMRLASDVNVRSCYMLHNLLYGDPFTVASGADATVDLCFMDIPNVQVLGIKFSSCQFNAANARPQTFYGMNTYGCEAIPEELGLDNFFAQFTSEETICLIIVGIALGTAVVQGIFLVIKRIRNNLSDEFNVDEYDYYDYYDDEFEDDEYDE